MTQPPQDPYARYRPEGYAAGQVPQAQQPQFIPNGEYAPPPPQGPVGPQFYPQQPPGPVGPQFQAPQPSEPPKKKRHWVRNTFLGFAGFIVLMVIITVAKGSGSSNGPSVAAPPDATATKSSPAAKAPAAAPAAFHAQTLLNVSGSGEYTTQKFTVGGSGDYDVDWTYNEGSMGNSVNFDFTADGYSDINLTGPNQLGSGGSGVTHVYNDAGTHYLQVSSEGNWRVKVVTTK